jgi:hypothetical protein
LGDHFQVATLGHGEKAAREVWDLMEADGSQQVLGFGTAVDGTWHLAHASTKLEQRVHELAPEHSTAWAGLAVSLHHVFVLGHLIPGEGGVPQCHYVHRLEEAQSAISNRQCELAVLVPPATMSHVEQIAGNLEKMPPKSTYFYPKLLSGLVFNPLTSS